ncbi:hypothetical protein [Trichloromonas sp.]|uniref:hypothetical protein n=1 Tax=Trichloromonas sp. TaxID=3069249 RepID=UPI002A477564|nr:hypothetical protein [Trichloromonas sp.]
MRLVLFAEALFESQEFSLDAAFFVIAAFSLNTGRFGSLERQVLGVGKGFSGLTIRAVGHEGFAGVEGFPCGSISCRSQFGSTAGMGFGEGRARGFEFPVRREGAAVDERRKEDRWKKKSVHATVFVGR